MKVTFLLMLLVSLSSLSHAQETPTAPETKQPQPLAPEKGIGSNPVDLPLPDGEAAPSGAPSILPESSLLPTARSIPLSTPEPPISLEQKKQNAKRIAEARVSAMRNPRAVSLLGEAKSALTTEARRNFLRAYFTTVCTQMRKMEPDLRGPITSFEQEQVRRIARSKNLAVTNSGVLAE
jgi:hypothetical protein